MAVENHELVDSFALERPRNVAEYCGLSARIHVDAETNVELAGVDSIRNHWKNRHARACSPRFLRRLGRDKRRLIVVGPIGKMEVVRFGRTPRQHAEFVVRAAHGFPRCVTKYPGISAHL